MLNDTLKDRKRKGKTPVEWTPEHEEVFAKVKESLIQATRLDTLTRNSSDRRARYDHRSIHRS